MELMKLIEKLQKQFHKFWLEHGEPHPSSNRYINMVKAFYYTEGYKAGMNAERRHGNGH